MKHHSLEFLAPSELKPRKRAWRTHNRKQIAAVERSLAEWGVVEPPLIDADNNIVCGTLIVELAISKGLNQIPVIRVGNLTPDQLRLYAIAANRLADLASYDDELLAQELRELEQLLDHPDMGALGFEDGELDRLLGLAAPADFDNDEEVEISEHDEPITQFGDLWQVGPHRVLCGNALERSSYDALMAHELAQFVLSDVPYNLSRKTISSNEQLDDFKFAFGEMSPGEFTRFLTTAMRHIQAVSEDGSLHAFFMSYHFLLELLRAGTIVFDRPKAIVTWVKSQPGQGGLFRSQSEFIAYFKNGEAPYRNNVSLGRWGRNRSNVWQFDGMTTPSAERAELLKLHATPKPVDMLKEAILDVTARNGIVLDPFAGIGSLTLAAHATERRAFTMEIEPKYVDAALHRVKKHTGIEPVRTRDGAQFSELAVKQIRTPTNDEEISTE
ncbi:site-specific DNA-methyltransferase [Novosphingobium sp.]|uniref:site-specific DNA-methyltransferase n=1 Tax=Novosphingobium sp. TaxID=1874826 RepID=UPI003D135221